MPENAEERHVRISAGLVSNRLPANPHERDALFASLRTPTDSICRAAEDAWEQSCSVPTAFDKYDQLRLDAAVIGSENLPGITDFGKSKSALTQWLSV